MKPLVAVGLVAAFAACGGDDVFPVTDAPIVLDDASPSGLLAKLNAIPGVTATATPTQFVGFQYFVLQFTQPVDHDDPNSATFQQEVSLMARDDVPGAPMIVETDGYWDYNLDYPVELTQLLTANQISIEHRFFGSSIPATPDWSKLTIKQMAQDEHAIVTALKPIFTGPYIATGASKGGMTSVYFRRFFPDDVAGTVPYVAPLSFAAGDARYAAFLGSNGTQPCHQNIRDVAVEMLTNRRAALESRATAEASAMGYTYTLSGGIPAAVEDAVESLEWSFWQYSGVGECNTVPAVTASDDDLWTFLQAADAVSGNSDAYVAAFAPYDFQAEVQLGYPDGGEEAYLGSDELYGSADTQFLPAGAPAPTYDGGSAMHDVDTYVQTEGKDLLFVYGQWDPWTAGAFSLGSATDAALYIQAQGTHGSEIDGLAAADKQAAENTLAVWAKLPLVAHHEHRDAPKPPRVPSAIVRALRHHKR